MKEIIRKKYIYTIDGKLIESLDFEGYSENELIEFGISFHLNGDIINAKSCYIYLVEADIKNPSVFTNYAAILQIENKLDDAIDLYIKSINYFPKFVDAYSNLGSLYYQMGELNKAKIILKKGIKINPNLASLYNNLGITLKEQSEYDEAIKYLTKAIKLDSKYADANYNLGILYKDLGDFKKAINYLSNVIEISPKYSKAYLSITEIKQFNPKEDCIKFLFSKEILVNQNEKSKSNIFFARANILHKRRKYFDSQSSLNIANDIKAKLDPPIINPILEKSRYLYLESDHYNQSDLDNKIEFIFIVGMPRCGSTLLESILTRNNQIFDLGEKDILEKSFYQWKQNIENNIDSNLYTIYKQNILKITEANITTNKWLYNYQYTGVISKLIKNSRIIYCYRNPLDNILSIYRAHFATGNHYASSIRECSKVYLNHQIIMDLYKQKYSDLIYSFDYDALIKNPDKEIKSLIEWIGFNWMDEYLTPHLNYRTVSTASNVQVREPINKKSLDGWKNYKMMLGPAMRIVNKDNFVKEKCKFIQTNIFKKAVQFHDNNNIEKAKELYQLCHNNNYNHIDLFLRYGGILFENNEYILSLNIYKEGIKTYPKSADLLTNISIVYLMIGKYLKAKKYIEDSLYINPDSAHTNSVYASILKGLNQFAKARRYIEKSISIDPKNSKYIIDLASIMRDIGDLNSALRLCLKAIDITPEFSEAYSIKGVIERDLGDFLQAKKSVLKAIKLNPSKGDYYLNLSAIYIDLGDLGIAEQTIKKSISINSNSSEAYLNLGNILRDTGRIRESQESIESAIRINPKLAKAYYALSVVASSSFNKDILNILFSDEILKDQSLISLSHIYFARSNIQHSLSKYNDSQLSLTKANQYKMNVFKSDSDFLIQKSQQLMAISNTYYNQSNISNNQFNHIFIVGMPRSGSTLLESILNMNKDVFDLGETNILENSFEEYNNKNVLDKKLSEIYIQKMNHNRINSSISTDKWLFNYQYAGIICSLIPNSRIINCYRHPLDNILSIYRANFDNRGNHFSSSLEETARLYLEQEDTILKYKSKFPSNIYMLNYDKLVLNPSYQIRKLIRWLGWEWNNEYQFPHLTKRNISTASSVQARSPINSKSLGGWINYNELLQPAINILSKRVKYKDIGSI
ncbi:tetratricopeptide repeat-containing sulfotransferase family protein [Prochlorococcus sp. MIT 0801]|uniref:tetratricopeptide repeat-containing sulfotransferase family protein n=1 Tax=Prochlorococcus sp. MIT 0801 TaxID=1501269 RepID=UPI0004F7BFA3|nr:tetratricopeptide repeat-containing sulfotransferase family protein [Prochlorococcus sp. MIT 0801]AIQ96634.1 TPR repeat [Prochlorococcus sp. MIT 0801]